MRADARAPGGYELDVSGLAVIQEAHDYPITPKEHGVDFLQDHRHLWIRSARQQAILRIRHEIVGAIRDFFNGRGFVLVDTPILTPAACEGTTTLFEVPYFEGETAYLSQSGQLYNEANALALGRVYTFGPTFRAEKSKTRRHLTEFWMVEPEVAPATLDDVIELAEALVVEVVARVLDRRRPQLETLGRDVATLETITAPFPRLSYDDAVSRLQAGGSAVEWGQDFGGPDETALGEAFDRPVVVHRFPTANKAFYMEPDPERADLCLSVDLIAPEGYGEIVGGGQRIADLDLLERRARRARAATRGLRVVSRPAPLRLRPPRRIRHGPGAGRVVDLRPGPRPGGHSLPPDALPADPLSAHVRTWIARPARAAAFAGAVGDVIRFSARRYCKKWAFARFLCLGGCSGCREPTGRGSPEVSHGVAGRRGDDAGTTGPGGGDSGDRGPRRRQFRAGSIRTSSCVGSRSGGFSESFSTGRGSLERTGATVSSR